MELEYVAVIKEIFQPCPGTRVGECTSAWMEVGLKGRLFCDQPEPVMPDTDIEYEALVKKPQEGIAKDTYIFTFAVRRIWGPAAAIDLILDSTSIS